MIVTSNVTWNSVETSDPSSIMSLAGKDMDE